MDLLIRVLDTGWEGPTRVPKADTVLSWEVDRVQKRNLCLAATLVKVSQMFPGHAGPHSTHLEEEEGLGYSGWSETTSSLDRALWAGCCAGQIEF